MSENRNKMSEKQKACKHEWFCRAGMYVDLYECNKCHWDTRDPSKYE